MKIVFDAINFGAGAGAGFVGAAFAPAVGRKIKALFVKDTASLKVSVAKAQAALEVEQAKLAKSVAADAAKVAAKV